MPSDFLDTFQFLKTILCLCPHCNSMLRLSDLSLREKKMTNRTFLDEYDVKEKGLDKKEEVVGLQEDDFLQKESKIREKAVLRGRSKVLKTVRKSMDKHFAKMNYNPYDIKPILHPIDFVIYDGMNEEKMNDVVFLSKKTRNPYIDKLHSSISDIIAKEKYDFQVARIDFEGNVNFE